MFTTLISTTNLDANLGDPNWVIIDCRFSLANPEQGQSDYIVAHIPGAVYVHLERDLSGVIIPGKTGRHPLPHPDRAAALFANVGISNQSQVVAYDAAGGALAAARVWWMLKWLGHSNVAVLDGGWQKWLREYKSVRKGNETRPPAQFIPTLLPEMVVGAEDVEVLIAQPVFNLFDSRSEERYRGENETIDPVAGHIPGAKPAPYSDNLTPEGTFRTQDELRNRFKPLLSLLDSEKSVFYCGSGVTAIHNILAMSYAGLGMPKLYAGSWSEWIIDPERPIEK